MKIIKYTWSEIEGACADVCRQMQKDAWMPDYIVGITRGGLIPSTLISHYLSVPLHTLSVSLRDQVQVESNLWMAEDAFGYLPVEERTDAEFEITHLPVKGDASSYTRRKNILIVDDINDTGKTFQWIQQDWPSVCLPDHERWQSVWNQNVRFAVLHNNESSDFKDVDYAANYINKSEQDCWIVYPWEALAPA